MKVQDKVAEIAKLCVEITMNTDYDVSIDYCSHLSHIEVNLYNGGWDYGKDGEVLGCHLDFEDAIDQLNSITKKLQDLLK